MKERFVMSWQEVATQWKTFEGLESNLRKQLNEMSDDQLKDAFYAPLEFGTAGMRGIVGPGINRMNQYTVRQATKGLATLILDAGEEAKKRGVVIAYDSRHFSPEFAMDAACTLGKLGIKSYVFESLRPTPELSFAVRYLNTYAGIMITASHNPSAYNGYKVYGEDGGQMPPHDANALTNYVRQIKNPLEIQAFTKEELQASGLCTMIGEDVDQAYLHEMKKVTINPELFTETNDELAVVYTPLHGTGKMLAERALAQAGFKGLHLVKEQSVPDGDFSTVASPNPEEAGAFEYAIRLGKVTNADLLLATDPDADRLGAAVRLPNGEYQVITGNQIAAILLDYILLAKKDSRTLSENSVAVKSIVSSELPTVIAKHYGVEMLNVLTGFKFIAEKIKQFEQTKEKEFVFGFEESYGFLIKDFARDKDAIQTLVLLVEVAAYYKKLGKTLYDGLEGLYEKHGHFMEKTISITIPGIEGAQKIKSLMNHLRQESPKVLGGIAVQMISDFATSQQKNVLGEIIELDYPSSDVLKYDLSDGSWVAARPSGTEPKIKFYMGVQADSRAQALEKIQLLEKDIELFTK